MQEESWRTNHGGEILEGHSCLRNHYGWAIMSEKSWSRTHRILREKANGTRSKLETNGAGDGVSRTGR